MRYFKCQSCHKTFTLQRNPRQTYCSNPRCQALRKNRWRQKKLAEDEDYRANQRASAKRWRVNHSDYWRNYRQSHPEYTQRNREQSRRRQKTQTAAKWLETHEKPAAEVQTVNGGAKARINGAGCIRSKATLGAIFAYKAINSSITSVTRKMA